MRTRASATTTTSAAFTGGTSISWTCCRAFSRGRAPRSPTWRGCSALPGKLGFSGAKVWDAYLAGDIVGIRRYCETDVLNTYLIYLRFELMRGDLTRERHAEEVERVKVALRAGTEPHFAEFLRAWEAAG